MFYSLELGLFSFSVYKTDFMVDYRFVYACVKLYNIPFQAKENRVNNFPPEQLFKSKS